LTHAFAAALGTEICPVNRRSVRQSIFSDMATVKAAAAQRGARSTVGLSGRRLIAGRNRRKTGIDNQTGSDKSHDATAHTFTEGNAARWWDK